MKRIVFCILLVVYGGMALHAQDTAIAFEDQNWASMLAEAKQTGKLIFMDAHTSWCGPCKWMSKNVFPLPEVAALYNRNFVNAYIDMEKGEGIELRKKYEVHFYPTYLFINGDGEVVHRVVGQCPAPEFIQHGLDAMSPQHNYAYFKKNYAKLKNNLAFLNGYLQVLQNANETESTNEIALTYLRAQDQQRWQDPANWELINDYVQDASSDVFQYLVANQAAFAGKYGEQPVAGKISNTYLGWPHTYVSYPGNGQPVLDEAGFNRFLTQVAQSNYAGKQDILARSRLTVYFGMRDWDKYAATVQQMLQDSLIHKNVKGADELYGYADNINRFAGEDQPVLKKAVDLTEIAAKEVPGISEYNKALYQDLYATLLEKTGQKKAAKKVRKSIDEQKLADARKGVPFVQMRIIPHN